MLLLSLSSLYSSVLNRTNAIIRWYTSLKISPGRFSLQVGLYPMWHCFHRFQPSRCDSPNPAEAPTILYHLVTLPGDIGEFFFKKSYNNVLCLGWFRATGLSGNKLAKKYQQRPSYLECFFVVQCGVFAQLTTTIFRVEILLFHEDSVLSFWCFFPFSLSYHNPSSF